MSRRLPNLNQLRAFEAAARHLSFKKAADELHVTHAAISHQIKALEEDLGRPLFRRLTRQVELVPEAAELARHLARSFDEIAGAVHGLRLSGLRGRLRITAVPAFGYRFVLPILPAFGAAHPEIEVEVDLHAGIVELGGDGHDAALRYGGGEWAGIDARIIARDTMTPVASPALIAGEALPLSPARIAALPYAVSPGARRDWRNWCRAVGLENPARPTPLVLENRAMVLDFLVSGGGVGLADLLFASRELESGQLVRLHPATVAGVNGTYLVWPKAPPTDPKIAAFGDWLQAEVDAIRPADDRA